MALEVYEDGIKAYKNYFYDRAIAHLKKALKITKIPSFYFALGNSYLYTRHYEDAFKNYQAALSLHGKDPDCKNPENHRGEAVALGNIGVIYEKKDDLDNALKYLQDSKTIYFHIGAKPELRIIQDAIDKIQAKKR